MAQSGAKADSLEPCGCSEAWRPRRLGTPTEEPSLHPFTGPTPGAPPPTEGPAGPVIPLPSSQARLQITLPSMRADESSQTDSGPEVGLATRKPRRHEGRVPSQQPIAAL